jgi:peptidoglycan/xylan/chitin deacetylase (PgdA/CDA1 family)
LLGYSDLPTVSRLKSVGHAITYRSGISAAIAKLQGCARIIMYHGVSRRDLLAAQLEYLRRHFSVVSLDRLVQRLASGQSLKHNEIVLTFDDGLMNNATVAYPELARLEMPATFFVCPGLIDSRQWLWTYEARCRLRSLTPNQLSDLATCLSCSTATEDSIVEWMKTLDLKLRQAAEDKIRQATPAFQPNALDREAYELMDWNTLGSLDPEIITIGSHTLTHPILPTLDEAAINFEMKESRRLLEQKLDRPVNYFCYPNGSHDPRTYKAARHTYKAAVTTEIGVVAANNPADVYGLPRIPATRNSALMAWRLHRPEA